MSAENTNDIDLPVQVLIKREIPELLANNIDDSYNRTAVFASSDTFIPTLLAVFANDFI